MFGYIKNSLTIVLGCFILQGSFAQQTGGKGTFTNLGPQLFTTMIQGSIFVQDSSDNLMVYAVVRGEPAHLVGYDIASHALRVDVPLPNSDGVWEMVSNSQGDLYIPGAGGTLFRHRVGTRMVTDLGQVLPGETYVWSLTAGKDGEVFGATYPGCRIFRYHPEDGFSDVIGGPVVEGENYVRSLVFNPRTGLLYAGIGARAHLVEIDPATKRRTEILPKAYRHKDFVYTLRLVTAPGEGTGDRLLVTLTPGRNTLVLNLETKQVEQEIEHLDITALAGNGGISVATFDNHLISFDAKVPFSPSNVLAPELGRAAAIYQNDSLLQVLTTEGELVTVQPEIGVSKLRRLRIPPQPIPINALHFGIDGQVWMGGYLAGGHAVYHPASGQTKALGGLDQTEGMVSYEQDVIFGIYPKGRFYRYNTSNPWDRENNPSFLGQVEGQSRAFALLAIPERERVYAGMVPDYGKLGGELLYYDMKDGELQTHGSVVPSQSIISLAQYKGLIVGGTTISGGLGVRPVTDEGMLFVWDPDEAKIKHQCIPVEGAPAVMGLIQGPDGYIWGVAGGVLFVYDPAANEVLSRHRIYDAQPFGSHVWRGVFLVNHPSGVVYGTGRNELFRIDPETKAKTLLKNGAGLLIMGEQGDLYFRDHTDLWKYEP